MTAHDVAVVVVNHNTASHLAACLASLEAGGLAGVDAAVWVVDNASTDGSVDMVRRRFGAVRVIASPTNAGFAAANNLALRAAGFQGRSPEPGVTPGEPPHPGGDRKGTRAGPTYRHALLLNPDTLIPRGAVARLTAVLDAEPDVGVVGPKLVLPDGTLDLACRRAFPTPAVSFYRFSGLAKLFPRSRRFGRYNMTFLDPDAPADVDAVVGACMLVRGAALADVGLLDERFWMYGEDLDWALRIRQAGWRVVYRPHVVVRHVKRAASRASPEARYQFQRAMWLFYTKHYAADTPRWAHRLVMLGLALKGGPRLVRTMRGDAGGTA